MGQFVKVLLLVNSLMGHDETFFHKGSWIEIDREAFNENISATRLLIGNKKYLGAVLKANGCGHGLFQMAQLCEENDGVNYLLTFLLSDALFLRQQGIKKPILVLGCYDVPISEAIKQNIDVFVYDWECARAVCAQAEILNKKARVHLKVDTGMARLGFLPHEVKDVARFLKNNDHIDLVGFCSHFASVSCGIAYAQKQLRIFKKLLEALKKEGITFQFTHIASTSSVLAFPEAYECTTMVRCGGLIYGLYKDALLLSAAQMREAAFSLKPIMRWKSKVLTLKTLSKGSYIGYGNTFLTQRETKIAIISIGFYDGYYRRLSNCGHMMINGRLVPIIGRIAMNTVTLDVTDLPGVVVGSEVLVVGQEEGIRPRDLALQLKVIDYETMQSIDPKIPRVIA